MHGTSGPGVSVQILWRLILCLHVFRTLTHSQNTNLEQAKLGQFLMFCGYVMFEGLLMFEGFVMCWVCGV